MKIITNHILWWTLLFTATAVVSAITSLRITLSGMMSSIAGHLAFAVGISIFPWIFYKLIGKPLSSEEIMATITVGWMILAFANIWVMI